MDFIFLPTVYFSKLRFRDGVTQTYIIHAFTITLAIVKVTYSNTFCLKDWYIHMFINYNIFIPYTFCVVVCLSIVCADLN